MLEGFLCVDTYKLHCYSYIYILYICRAGGRGPGGGRAGAGRGPGGGRAGAGRGEMMMSMRRMRIRKMSSNRPGAGGVEAKAPVAGRWVDGLEGK